MKKLIVCLSLFLILSAAVLPGVANAASAGSNVPLGKYCVVKLRNANPSTAQLTYMGTLQQVDAEWVVVSTGVNAEVWIPKSTVLAIEFRPETPRKSR